MFFYKMIPHVKENAKCIELCHLPTWLNYNIGLVDSIDLRIFSTRKLKEEVILQYDENHLNKDLYNRLIFIDNAIDIPLAYEIDNASLEVVFIGRGAPQKRVHLIAEIAKQMHEAKDPVHFSFVGDVEKIIDVNAYPYCKFYGNIKDENLMNKIYNQSDVLILTSAFEGLPIVVMTMMAHGKIVLSTAVNGIPDYIEHMKNGLLIKEKDEPAIVRKGIELLRSIIQNPDLKKELGKNNRQIASTKFSREIFCKTYRKILLDN